MFGGLEEEFSLLFAIISFGILARKWSTRVFEYFMSGVIKHGFLKHCLVRILELEICKKRSLNVMYFVYASLNWENKLS